MKQSGIFLWLLIIISLPSFAQKSPCSVSPGYGKSIQEISTLKDLPQNIEESVGKIWLNRVGKTFYKRVKFNYGYVLDNSLLTKGDDTLYWLLFFVEIQGGDLDHYCRVIVLDNKGKFINRLDLQKALDLPDYRKNENLNTLLNGCDLKRKYVQKGFDTTSYEIDCWKGHIVYRFESKKTRGKGGTIPFYKVSVHTGNIIDTTYEIVMY